METKPCPKSRKGVVKGPVVKAAKKRKLPEVSDPDSDPKPEHPRTRKIRLSRVNLLEELERKLALCQPPAAVLKEITLKADLLLSNRTLYRNELTRLAIVIRDFFFCKVCKIQQPHMYRILDHIEDAHLKIWIYNCSFCNKELYSESSLVIHQANDHKDDANNEKVSDSI